MQDTKQAVGECSGSMPSTSTGTAVSSEKIISYRNHLVLHGISEEAVSAHIPWHHMGSIHIQGARIYILELSTNAKVIFILFHFSGL